MKINDSPIRLMGIPLTIVLWLTFLCFSPFLPGACGQAKDPYASAAKLVPKSDPAYKDATFMSDHKLLRGCPADYFSGQQLRTRYDFAINIDRILKRLKTGLLEIPNTFPNPYYDFDPFGGVNLEECQALKRLYFEFKSEVYDLDDDPKTCEAFLNRLEEIATRTSKISLKDLPDFHWDVKYRVDPYLRAAITLQAMGKEKAYETLLTLAREGSFFDNRQLFILCRMLFVAREGGKFRRPDIGSAGFLGHTGHPDWPLEPIEIVDGVPFVITQGYDLFGPPESAGDYIKYCIQNCDWNKTQFTLKSTAEKKKAMEKLLSSPKWKQSLSDREKAVLASQIEETKK